jgi:hypothetical protein
MGQKPLLWKHGIDSPLAFTSHKPKILPARTFALERLGFKELSISGDYYGNRN